MQRSNDLMESGGFGKLFVKRKEIKLDTEQ